MPITLEARNVGVARAGKWILKDVCLVAQPGTLTAIIGPNGAGKTTLLRTLSGDVPDAGQILLNGASLYANPAQLLAQIGYVPVDSVLPEGLTVLQALMHAGRIRLPGVAETELTARVDALLSEFDLPPTDPRRNSLLSRLSSGEKKRANICSELLTNPALLLLDEPTSNLDPDAERDLMFKLAARAHAEQQTILVITHTLNTIDPCDDVIFIENTRVRAQGSPTGVLAQLEAMLPTPARTDLPGFYRWAMVFDHFKTQPERRSPATKAELGAASTTRTSASLHAPLAHQTRTLLARYAQIRRNDPRGLALTLALGLVGGIFLFVLPAKILVQPESASEASTAIIAARQAIFILALITSLLGLISSFVEISREWRIYRHERVKGLSPLAYVLSKWLWLSALVGIIAPSLMFGWMVGLLQQELPIVPVAPLVAGLMVWVTLVLTCIASITLGLLLSALAAGSGKESLFLALAVIFLVLFSGLIKNGAVEQLVGALSMFSTSRWAFEGTGSSLGLYCWAGRKEFDEFNSHGHLLSVHLALVVYTLIALGLAWLALRVRDPWFGARTNALQALRQNRVALLGSLLLMVVLSGSVINLRSLSFDYHRLTFSGEPQFGGTGGMEYARIDHATSATRLQHVIGWLSQTQCESSLPDPS